MEEVILFQRPSDESNLWVTGLPRDVTYNVLYHMFSEQGLLYELQLFSKPGHIPGGLDVLTYAFVKYYSVMEANQAMTLLDGHILDGCRIRIAFAQRSKPPDHPPVLIIVSISRHQLHHPWSLCYL
jgi:RNA recognition motif-containing protein